MRDCRDTHGLSLRVRLKAMIEKRMKKGPAPRTLNADVWQALFFALGPTRDLKGVREYGVANELLTPSLATLRRWSAGYKWYARAAEHDARSRTNELAISDAVMLMNERQATTARAMLAVVDRSLDKQKDGIVPLEKLPEVLATATRVERVAMGAATDRQEISMAFVTTMAPKIVEIFIAVNLLPDPEQRANQFLEEMNALAAQFVSAA